MDTPRSDTDGEASEVRSRRTHGDSTGARDPDSTGARDTDGDGEQSGPASTVVLSYPADLSAWGRDIVEGSPFRAYLRKTAGTLGPDDVLEEFVGVGCCGSALDVPLRVESVEGGDRIDENTEVRFVVREACGIEGGWRVQSAGGPN